jgi:hypothetical protein
VQLLQGELTLLQQAERHLLVLLWIGALCVGFEGEPQRRLLLRIYCAAFTRWGCTGACFLGGALLPTYTALQGVTATHLCSSPSMHLFNAACQLLG